MCKIFAVLFIIFVHLQSRFCHDHPSHAGSYFNRFRPVPNAQSDAATAAYQADESPAYWKNSARVRLQEKVNQRLKIGRAKNIVMFLGDGHGVTSLSLTRILVGQQVENVKWGEEGNLTTDYFPQTGLSRTFCVDSQVPDSACATTAYLCGVKNNYGTIGVTSDVHRDDCPAGMNPANHLQSILKWAQDAGKATGIVTTTRITHATPAGAYAHTAERNWECDADVLSYGVNPATCSDIAEQLVLEDIGKKFNVIMGGGRAKFLPNNETDITNVTGSRLDGKNLVEIWLDQHNANAAPGIPPAQYVQTRIQLLTQVNQKTKYLLGLFDHDHMQYYPEQIANNEPTLPEMVTAAIKVLSQNPNGYFLFVEGGRIDLAHHTNQALLASWEGEQFDQAIKVADTLTDDANTLIVVTADHSHTLSFAGYAPRGTPISGLGGMGADDIPYGIMNYANGPAWVPFYNNQRHNISQDNMTDIYYADIPLVPITNTDVLETHGGEDVAIFAKGPFDHLFSGVFQQNYIPWAIAYPACIGPGPTLCYEHQYQF